MSSDRGDEGREDMGERRESTLSHFIPGRESLGIYASMILQIDMYVIVYVCMYVCMYIYIYHSHFTRHFFEVARWRLHTMFSTDWPVTKSSLWMPLASWFSRARPKSKQAKQAASTSSILQCQSI